MSREFTVTNPVGIKFTEGPEGLICQFITSDEKQNFYVTTYAVKAHYRESLEKYLGRLTPIVIRQEDEKMEEPVDGRDKTAE